MINLIIKPREIVLAIENNLLTILLVEKKKNELDILDYLQIDLIDNLSLLDQVEHVKSNIDFKGINRSKVYLVVNDVEANSEIIKLPRIEYDKQLDILNYKYLKDKDDYNIQFLHTNREDKNRLYDIFLIYKLSKKSIKDYEEFIKNLGLKPMVLDIKSNALRKLIRFSGLINNRYLSSEESFLIIDFKNSITNIEIIEKNQISYLNSLQLGARHILDLDLIENRDDDEIIYGHRKLIELVINILGEKISDISSIIILGLTIDESLIIKIFEDIYPGKLIRVNNFKNINIINRTIKPEDYLFYLGGIIREGEVRWRI